MVLFTPMFQSGQARGFQLCEWDCAKATLNPPKAVLVTFFAKKVTATAAGAVEISHHTSLPPAFQRQVNTSVGRRLPDDKSGQAIGGETHYKLFP